jgi:hypothetical protein
MRDLCIGEHSQRSPRPYDIVHVVRNRWIEKCGELGVDVQGAISSKRTASD